MAEEHEEFRAALLKSGFTKSTRALVIDEAHCISEWGGDFRPHYGVDKIGTIRSLFPLKTPVLAASATMNERTLLDVRAALHIDADKCFHLNLGNDRPNIETRVFQMKSSHDIDALFSLIDFDVDAPELLTKTLVFVNDRRTAQSVCDKLRHLLPSCLKGSVDFLTALRSRRSKRIVTKNFADGFTRILIATEVYGMVSPLSPLLSYYLSNTTLIGCR